MSNSNTQYLDSYSILLLTIFELLLCNVDVCFLDVCSILSMFQSDLAPKILENL